MPSELNGAALLRDSLVWDNHGCLPMDTSRLPRFVVELSRYRSSGVDIASINVGFGPMSLSEHLSILAFLRSWVRSHSREYMLVSTTDDIRKDRRENKLGVVFDIEGMDVIGDDPMLIDAFYDLGVRWMLLTYNRNNAVGGGCLDEDHGLTDFGRTVLDQMARTGMVVCCSHVGYRTARDVCDYHSDPVIMSHSNPLVLCDDPRNVPDDLVKAVAETGGVIGINGIGKFLAKPSDTSSHLMARHIDYLVNTVGIEHVGIGLDYVFDMEDLDNLKAANPGTFPGYNAPAESYGFGAPEQLCEIADCLLSTGYSESDLRAILGQNLLRVAEAVWRPNPETPNSPHNKE